MRSGPEAIKLFSCSTRLSMKITLQINMKMPTLDKFHAQLSWAWKKFYNLGARFSYRIYLNYWDIYLLTMFALRFEHLFWVYADLAEIAEQVTHICRPWSDLGLHYLVIKHLVKRERERERAVWLKCELGSLTATPFEHFDRISWNNCIYTVRFWSYNVCIVVVSRKSEPRVLLITRSALLTGCYADCYNWNLSFVCNIHQGNYWLV